MLLLVFMLPPKDVIATTHPINPTTFERCPVNDAVKNCIHGLVTNHDHQESSFKA
jgi:hypothetical protein